MPNPLSLPLAALGATARTLAFVGAALERLADVVRPAPAVTPRASEATGPAGVLHAVPPAAAAADGSRGTPPGLVPFDPQRLVANPAPTVIEAIASLSTEQLGELYDAERSARRRRSVVLAIENTLLPPAPALRDLPAEPENPGAGARLAYSTETPRGRSRTEPV